MLRRPRARRALTLAAIPPPPFEALELGHLRLTLHGLLILVPALIAVAWTARRWKARGGSPELVLDVAVWALLGGIVGAHLYHVATSWSELPDAWWGPFAVWRGGLAVATALVLASGALLARTQRGPRGDAVVEGARAP
jgi:prolipoprotein diacylglyceryltransferase